jgi:hypothetical protein
MEILTQHAVTRMQQRGIKFQTVEMLLQCGAKEHDHRGATVLYFDKQARQRLYDQYGAEQLKKIDRQLDTYAVIAGSGAVVTVGHRTRRINRN